MPSKSPVGSEVVSSSEHFGMHGGSHIFRAASDDYIHTSWLGVVSRLRQSIGLKIDIASSILSLNPPVFGCQVLVKNSKPLTGIVSTLIPVIDSTHEERIGTEGVCSWKFTISVGSCLASIVHTVDTIFEEESSVLSVIVVSKPDDSSECLINH